MLLDSNVGVDIDCFASTCECPESSPTGGSFGFRRARFLIMLSAPEMIAYGLRYENLESLRRVKAMI